MSEKSPMSEEDMGDLHFLRGYGSRYVYRHTLTGLSPTKHLTVKIMFLNGFTQMDFDSNA